MTFRIFFFFSIASLVFASNSFAIDPPLKVASVVVEGNQRIDREAILAQLSKTSGEFSSEEISKAVKAIYETGFFDDVIVRVQKTASGSNILAIKVTEKPIVRKIFIVGNKDVDEKDLSEIFKFDSFRFFDKSKIEGLIKQAVSLYQARGYYDAALEFSVVPVGENQLDITFSVNEGQKYRIKKVVFRGLQTIKADDLREAIQTKQHVWWKSWLLGTGRVNKEMLENDRGILRQYFLDHGLLDASVSEPMIESNKDQDLVVVFEVKEGPLYHIGKISSSGDTLPGVEPLEDLKSKEGDIFNASALREDSFKVSDKFSDRGFAFVNVVPNTFVKREKLLVDIDYQVSKGNLVTVRKILIKGNSKTYDNVIRRELTIDEQEQFSSSKVRRSQKLLQRLGYFDESSITQEAVPSGNEVDLVVNVKETSTGQFSAGAGYSSSDGMLFNVRLSENNLFGTGRKGVINADIGSERNNLILSLEDRRLDDTFLSGGVDLQRTEREFDDFDRTLTGGGVTLGYPLEHVFGEWAQDIAASTKYELMRVKISNVNREDSAPLIIASEGRSTSSSITPRIARSTINNPLNPTEGSRQEVSVELAGLGGDQEFYLLEGRQMLYYPLMQREWGDLVFAWRTVASYGETFNNDPFPLFRRSFLGGINSVRGFKNRTLGPKDEKGHEYGGSKEFVNNFELIFPIINSAGLRGVVFYDAGQAFDDNEDIELGKLREAYGAGIRWSSPLGPIRVEVGFPIDREEGEDSMVTQFSFGAPF